MGITYMSDQRQLQYYFEVLLEGILFLSKTPLPDFLKITYLDV